MNRFSHPELEASSELKPVYSSHPMLKNVRLPLGSATKARAGMVLLRRKPHAAVSKG